jgi:hypothetical protein
LDGSDCRSHAVTGGVYCGIHTRRLLKEEGPVEQAVVNVAASAPTGETERRPVPDEIANAEAYADGFQKTVKSRQPKDRMDDEASAHVEVQRRIDADQAAKRARLMARGDIGKLGQDDRQPYGAFASQTEFIHDPLSWVGEKGEDLREKGWIYRWVRTVDHRGEQSRQPTDLYKRYGGELVYGSDGQPVAKRDVHLMRQRPEGYIEKVRYKSNDLVKHRQAAEDNVRESVKDINRNARSKIASVYVGRSHGRLEDGVEFDEDE